PRPRRLAGVHGRAEAQDRRGQEAGREGARVLAGGAPPQGRVHPPIKRSRPPGVAPPQPMIAYIVSLFAGVGLWTALAVTLIAGLMRGFAGFGSAMLMAPIFAILFGSAEMVVTVVAIEL